MVGERVANVAYVSDSVCMACGVGGKTSDRAANLPTRNAYVNFKNQLLFICTHGGANIDTESSGVVPCTT